jgi:phage shock protein C
MEYKRLYRSNTNKVIGGVAGGMAEHFATDPVLVRVLFVLAAIFGGGGVLIYIILWIVIPSNPVIVMNNFTQNTQAEKPGNENTEKAEAPPAEDNKTKKKRHDGLIGGLILITIGVIFLINRLIPEIDFEDLWPVILIVIGLGILIGSITRKK